MQFSCLYLRNIESASELAIWLLLIVDAACSGLPANGTIAAEVAFMFAEWYKPNAKLEFPRGGSQSIINALVRCWP